MTDYEEPLVDFGNGGAVTFDQSKESKKPDSIMWTIKFRNGVYKKIKFHPNTIVEPPANEKLIKWSKVK